MSSLSFSSEKGVHARARNEGASLSRLAPSVTCVVIYLSQAFCLMVQEKRETARSLTPR